MSNNIHQFFRAAKNTDAADAYALGHKEEFESAQRLLGQLEKLRPLEARQSAGLFRSTTPKRKTSRASRDNVVQFTTPK